MKRLLFLQLLVAICVCGYSQEVKKIEPRFEDYLSLFKEQGYNMFCHETSSICKEATQLSLIVQEYVNGEQVESKYHHNYTFDTRYMISDFDEEDQKTIKESGKAYDEKNDIYRLATKIRLGFTPVKGDTLQVAHFDVLCEDEMMSACNFWLMLRDNRVEESHRKTSYHIRPFEAVAFEKDKFIPLALYASDWWDADAEFYRFCGEIEIPANMKSYIIKHTPHYFVIGVKFE